MKATTAEQTPLLPALIPTLPTKGPRRIKCTSLRPGDWLAHGRSGVPRFLVLQNSAKLQRVEVWTDVAPSTVWGYEALAGLAHVGQGVRRRWRKFLPRFIRRHVCKYSPPTP